MDFVVFSEKKEKVFSPPIPMDFVVFSKEHIKKNVGYSSTKNINGFHLLFEIQTSSGINTNLMANLLSVFFIAFRPKSLSLVYFMNGSTGLTIHSYHRKQFYLAVSANVFD